MIYIEPIYKPLFEIYILYKISLFIGKLIRILFDKYGRYIIYTDGGSLYTQVYTFLV